MGCVPSRRLGIIQKSTAIEVLNEEEFKLDPKNVCTAKFWSHGHEVKIHFRKISSKISPND